MSSRCAFASICFNPRPCEGATASCGSSKPALDVSIHAPVKGRPLADVRRWGGVIVSIHAPVKGRPASAYTRAAMRVSIHAPVKGRHHNSTRGRRVYRFNPRPCEGATSFSLCMVLPLNVSIHAPVKGRLGAVRGGGHKKRFNPRPCEGATSASAYTCAAMRRFNPRPCEGATLTPSLAHKPDLFQSTPL